MVKTYKALGTQVCMPIVVNGCVIRIEFHPVSNFEGRGGSEFTTGNPLIQQALENNPDFGNVYLLVNKDGEMVTKIEEEAVNEKVEEPVEDNLVVVEVTSLADAKNWLVDNKGWEPVNRPKKKDIVDVAKAYGVVFNGI